MVVIHIAQTDLLHNFLDNYKSGCDLLLGIVHLCRMFRDKDLYISGLCKLYFGHIPNWPCTQVGMMEEHQHIRVGKSILRDCSRFCTHCKGRKVMGRKDLSWVLQKQLKILRLIVKFLWNLTNWLVLLGCGRWQEVNGFPVYPGRQAQVGAWLGTVHSALMPQVPGQGSLHLLLTQALFLGQSEFVTHSGLHPV